MIARRPWTGAERRDALRWHAGGMRMARVAAALGRTPKAVEHKLRQWGAFRKRHAVPTTEAAAARAALAFECAAVRAERATTPPYKPGPLQW